MTTEEIWRVVPSVPGLSASSWGRIRTDPWMKGNKKYGGKAWHGAWDGKRFVTMFRGKNYKVGRLVCEAFHGPPPFPRAVCMHMDEDSRNNRPENLQWGTQKQNLNAPGFIAYCRARTGENSPIIKGRKNKAQD